MKLIALLMTGLCMNSGLNAMKGQNTAYQTPDTPPLAYEDVVAHSPAQVVVVQPVDTATAVLVKKSTLIPRTRAIKKVSSKELQEAIKETGELATGLGILENDISKITAAISELNSLSYCKDLSDQQKNTKTSLEKEVDELNKRYAKHSKTRDDNYHYLNIIDEQYRRSRSSSCTVQ
jgi:hypothetical protein